MFGVLGMESWLSSAEGRGVAMLSLSNLSMEATMLVPPLSGIILSHLAVLLVCSNRQRRPLHPGQLAICGEEAAIGRKQHPLPDVSGGQQLVVVRRG